MEKLDNFVLYDITTERVRAKVWVEITDGCLKIEGQDFGADVEDFFGEDEYEYNYNFNEQNTEKLIIQLLKHENGSESNVPCKEEFKQLLLEKYSDMDGCVRLRKFCDEHEIEYKFSNWF